MSQSEELHLESLHALEIRLLRAFESKEAESLSDDDLPEAAGIGPGQVRRAAEWLLSKALLEVSGETAVVTVSLTELGIG